MFIATGQDVANVADSSALYGFSELLPNGDFYASVTLPSLIVGTYGGGTGLATQREYLEMLGCCGAGKVHKFAEIVAATVLAGELSLGSAVVAEEWVESHDQLGGTGPELGPGHRTHGAQTEDRTQPARLRTDRTDDP